MFGLKGKLMYKDIMFTQLIKRGMYITKYISSQVSVNTMGRLEWSLIVIVNHQMPLL